MEALLAQRPVTGIPAARMKAKTIDVAASHVSLINHPREIAELILGVARGLCTNGSTNGRRIPSLMDAPAGRLGHR